MKIDHTASIPVMPVTSVRDIIEQLTQLPDNAEVTLEVHQANVSDVSDTSTAAIKVAWTRDTA